MITDHIEEQLKPLNISLNEFTELMIRLLDYGVLCRDESGVEEQLYDRYLQCKDIVEDYLRVMAMRVQHESQFRFVRVYPPGARVPGVADEIDQPFTSGFRTRLSQQDIATILVLRAEYDKSLREGQIDESGCVTISLEALGIAHGNLLKRPLPETHTERRNLFKRLKQLRLIQYHTEEELEGTGEASEAWIRIRPTITSFVSDEVLTALMGDEETNADSKTDSEAFEDSAVIPASDLYEEA